VKRLVTQWGGEVVPEINVDTDFVVLGAEPQVPSFRRTTSRTRCKRPSTTAPSPKPKPTTPSATRR
jgi:hypothetical protein